MIVLTLDFSIGYVYHQVKGIFLFGCLTATPLAAAIDTLHPAIVDIVEKR